MVFKYLVRKSDERITSSSLICLTLVHNELNILPDFFEHYRSLGKVSFIIVDDHSNDGSTEYLLKQPDVTVFQPKEGSKYSEHKRIWRRDLMNHYAAGKWCLVPDADEHFVYLGMEQKNIHSFIDALEEEGVETILTAMLDMYADKPINEHMYEGGGLAKSFPYFDDQSRDYMSYRLQKVPRRYLKNYPTPQMFFCGGMRERVFYSDFKNMLALQKWIMQKFMHLGRSLEPSWKNKLENSFAKIAIKNLAKADAYNNTKLGLIKWREGARFSGGAHSVNQEFRISKSRAAFLHYKFTKGVGGLNYIAERGQHAGGSALYKQILDQPELLEQSPVFENSKMYEDSDSLKALL